ncbi:TetR/AcrR family transcriptional regulator [Rhizobium halophytocola]|uniref:AcrR family transcriptional regulator n=1 Tax=Rhizobium halophytocola TaxID=735519 RepID=A0ABS4DYQ8_9HYPH|nr:AcrR family transcriptional regulator [Rhizobium halophytocola]
MAQLLDGATAVFRERGYGAATMTEIAARAGAPIGSLYQFFPSKQSLVDALVERYGEHVVEALDAVEARAASLSAAQLARAFIGIFVDLRQERLLVVGLLDASWQEPSVRPARLRHLLRARIGAILRLWRPGVATDAAQVHAIVVLQMMKSHMQMLVEEDQPDIPRAAEHWIAMLADYIGRMDPGACASGAGAR